MLTSSVAGQCVLPVSFQPPVFCSATCPLCLARNAESQESGGVFHQLAACLVTIVPCFCMGEQLLRWRSSLGVMPSLR